MEALEPTLSKTPVLLEQLAGYTGCEKYIQNVRYFTEIDRGRMTCGRLEHQNRILQEAGGAT